MQELQDLEELQVLGAAGWGGGVFAPPLTFFPCFAPTEQSRGGCGLEVMSPWGARALFWGAVGDGRGVKPLRVEAWGGGNAVPWVDTPPSFPFLPLPAGFLAVPPRHRGPGRCPRALPQPAAPQSPPGGQRRPLLHHDRGRAGQMWWWQRGARVSAWRGTRSQPAPCPPQALVDHEQMQMLRHRRRLQPLSTDAFDYSSYHNLDEVMSCGWESTSFWGKK